MASRQVYGAATRMNSPVSAELRTQFGSDPDGPPYTHALT